MSQKVSDPLVRQTVYTKNAEVVSSIVKLILNEVFEIKLVWSRVKNTTSKII